ncbi:MAG: adenylosuccinate lyase [Candidatus Solibacter usitatus]|nr:adenylosuccinate lyase [Candidatus Solibacter usitatus]
MIARYTRPAMGQIWSDENKYRQWLAVELAAAETLAEQGEVPAEAAALLRRHAAFTVERILEIEKEVRHDVIAFTTCIAESMKQAGHPEASRWFHFGLTSNDVVDTAQALQLKESADLLLDGLDGLIAILKRRAFEFKDAVAIGRTHGVHAEPITFGLKIALWYDEAVRARRRLQEAAEDLRYGKLSGAVGTLGHLEPEAEEAICLRLGLKVSPIASQVIARDRHAAFVSAMALVCALCEKCALEVRHLQRTEVREAEEPFAEGQQKGSSAMPHKRNPIVSEQICGLARVVRANVQAAFEDIALWHERDISHSSVERVILPDSCILTDYLVAKTSWLVGGMRVDPERMRRNLESSKGLVFSGQVLLDLTAAGMLREQAYKIVQTEAMKAFHEEGDFRAAIGSHPDVRRHLTDEQIEHSFSVERQLKSVDAIFARVFGKQ